jgi:uncharacterized membrane protein YkoI
LRQRRVIVAVLLIECQNQQKELEMRLFAITASVLALGIASALADEPVSQDEAESIQAALQQWGCEGGEMERETGSPLIYEIDDAMCDDSEYDIKLDDKFDVILIARH